MISNIGNTRPQPISKNHYDFQPSSTGFAGIYYRYLVNNDCHQLLTINNEYSVFDAIITSGHSRNSQIIVEYKGRGHLSVTKYPSGSMLEREK